MLKKVGKVKKKVDCPRNFQCLKIPEKDKREVKESDIEGFLECRECESFCPFKCSFGFTYLCVCPMRNYLFKRTKTAPEKAPKIY